MSARVHTAAAARALSAAAVGVAAVLVPLLYAPALASPFTLPKEVAFQIAAALGFAAFLLRAAGGGGENEGGETGGGDDGGAGDGGGPGAAPLARPIVWGAILVLCGVALSAGIAAARGAPGAPYALGSFVRWLAFFGVALGVAANGGGAANRAGVLRAVTLSAGVVSAIGLWQHADLFALPLPVISAPGSTFGNRNLGGETIALALPMALGALTLARGRGERRLIVAALALELAYLGATRARGAWLGGALGIATVLLAHRRRWSRAAIIAAVGVGALALLIALLPGRPNPRYAADAKRFATGVDVVETSFDPDSTALRTRIGLWRRSLVLFRHHPVVGIGPGNWPVLFPTTAEPGATADGVLSATLSPRHAHQDLLECLTETGVVGLATLLLFGAGVAITARRCLGARDADRRAQAAAAAGTLVALVGAGITGFPLEMPATLALGGLALGLIASGQDAFQDRSRATDGASDRRRGDREDPHGRRARRLPVEVAVIGAVAVLAIAAAAGKRRLGGSYWLARAERALHADSGPAGARRALEALNRAEQVAPGSFRVALRTAHAENRLGHVAEATRAADAAIAREPFSPNAWAALAAVQMDGGDPGSARATANRSLDLLADYPFVLSVKARAAEALGAGDEARATWARLAALADTPESIDPELARSARALLGARDHRPPATVRPSGEP